MRDKCVVCDSRHNVAVKDKTYTFKAITPDAARALKGAESAEPWTSARGTCFHVGEHVLVQAPGEFDADDNPTTLIACSKVYQRKSSLRVKKENDRAAASTAAVAATTPAEANRPRHDTLPTLPSQGTRGYTALEAQLVEVTDERNALSRELRGACREITSLREASVEFKDTVRRELHTAGVNWNGSLELGMRRGRERITRLEKQSAANREAASSVTRWKRLLGDDFDARIAEAVRRLPALRS